MSFWTAIVLIVAISAIASVLTAKHKSQAGITTDFTGNETHHPVSDPAERAALEAEVRELRERVKVLERIAIDDRKRLGLADEIERLRDS